MKTKIKNILIKTASLLCIGLVTGFFLDLFILKAYCFIQNPVPVYEIAKVDIAKAVEIYPEETPMKDWVLKEFYKAGLNPDVADCVIWQESRWDDQKPPTKTNDYGLMQWNIQHIKSGLLNMGCAYNYRCAVKMAIEKIKKDKCWKGWYGYKDANCERFGKTFIK